MLGVPLIEVGAGSGPGRGRAGSGSGRGRGWDRVGPGLGGLGPGGAALWSGWRHNGVASGDGLKVGRPLPAVGQGLSVLRWVAADGVDASLDEPDGVLC